MLPLTPTKLGRYEIVDEIGKGAMGVVYLARDPLIGRLVALKTFRIGFSVKDRELEEFRTRFMREAQSAGILSHPNIVTIHDVVESSDEGLAFIAMEYVRGTNLKQVLQEGRPLTHQLVLDVISQVGDALDYAHASKVIHRDIKPANILITSEGRVKITDFGIARLETSNLTMDGQMLGTPNYMAPEQIQGKKEVDYRADLFSLGVVLYEMVTRQKPFSGENLTVVSHRIVYEPFTPPRDLVKELSPAIEAILERALQKDPAKRYQRARELVEELKRALAPGGAAAAQAPGLEATASVEQLNETMSLSQTMVLPPELPEPAAAPQRARRSGPGLSRWLAWGAGIAVLGVLAWAGVLLARQWSRPEPPQAAEASPPQSPESLELLRLVSQGHMWNTKKEYARAADAFGKAEALAPPERKAEISRLKLSAQAAAATLEKLDSRQAEIEQSLADGEAALAQGNRTEAIRLADAVLQLQAGHERAMDLRRRARTSTKGARTTSSPVPSPSAPEPTTAASPVPAGPEPEAPAREATLLVDFKSDYAYGVSVILRLDGDVLFRKDLDRGGIFRRKEGPLTFTHREVVSAANHTLNVHVAPARIRAAVQDKEGNFPGGGSRTLTIRVAESGVVSVSLN